MLNRIMLRFLYGSNIRGFLKICKENALIRPIVNWINTPAYKVAKKHAKDIHKYVPFPFVFNIKNSTQLMKAVLDIPYDTDLKFVSFDITNMYTNIPTNELPDIIRNLCIKTM